MKMSIEDGDNIRYNNALMQGAILETQQETANILRDAAKLEFKRQEILFAQVTQSAEAGEKGGATCQK
jgi:hypothetical protein